MLFRRSNKQDRERHEQAAASRIRSIGNKTTYTDADPDAVNRRLRNMSYGRTHSQVAATRPDYQAPQLFCSK